MAPINRLNLQHQEWIAAIAEELPATQTKPAPKEKAAPQQQPAQKQRPEAITAHPSMGLHPVAASRTDWVVKVLGSHAEARQWRGAISVHHPTRWQLLRAAPKWWQCRFGASQNLESELTYQSSPSDSQARHKISDRLRNEDEIFSSEAPSWLEGFTTRFPY